ncbi:MAG: hypothetical protein ACJA0U_001974 [Salibacteraceae bacterium]|jgi:hypothetical protein
MGQLIEINQGEILVKFPSPTAGRITFKELRITNEQHMLDGGFLPLKLDMQEIGEHSYSAVSTMEITYTEKCESSDGEATADVNVNKTSPTLYDRKGLSFFNL